VILRYKIVLEVLTDDPQGAKEALAMAVERRGSCWVVEVEPLEEQATMEGVLQAAAAARKQLEAAMEGRPRKAYGI